jgi:BASS family bile acid:Na+ symporter
MNALLAKSANFFPVWLLVFCGAALLEPAAFTWFSGQWIVGGLMLIMLGMGLTLEPADFRAVAKMPGAVAAGFAGQYTIMPAAGWFTAKALGLPPDFAVGLILVACAPGGTASNVVAYLARANVALSVVMTSCSTLAAVVVTPWLTQWLAGAYLPVDGWGMFLTTLQVVLGPVALGVFLNRKLPRVAGSFATWGPLVSVVLICMVCASIVGQGRDAILENLGVLALAVGVLHGLGFFVGWLAAWLLGFKPPEARAISIEVGMQNSGLAAVLAKAHFAANPLTAVPAALSSVAHSLIGSCLAAFWRARG